LSGLEMLIPSRPRSNIFIDIRKWLSKWAARPGGVWLKILPGTISVRDCSVLTKSPCEWCDNLLKEGRFPNRPGGLETAAPCQL